jgi:glycosyltransferase involved in cell wall biosynthesis
MNSSKRFHICLNLIADPNWHAGNIYIFNIVQAISKLPEEERKSIKLSLAVKNRDDIPDEIKAKTDSIYQDTIVHLGFYYLLKKLPALFRLKFFNFRKINFYYPGSNLPRKWIFHWGGWIPDFQYKHFPQLFEEAEWNDRERRNNFLAKESPLLAFSSQHAIEDYHQFFPQFKGNEFLLHFVSNANKDWLKDDPKETQQKFQLPDRFYIVCNQFWKHKDHLTLLETLHQLNKKGQRITIACTGSTEDFRNPEYFPSLMKQAAELEVSDQFKVLGFISRKDQIQLIRRSLAIIQPSLFEGWSTVVEDGRSLGKTIFLSDFPVHKEQHPPHTYYFKCKDSQQLADLITTHDHELTPGPDAQKEEEAYLKNQEMMAAFGKKFIEMAKFQSPQ